MIRGGPPPCLAVEAGVGRTEALAARREGVAAARGPPGRAGLDAVVERLGHLQLGVTTARRDVGGASLIGTRKMIKIAR